MGSRSLIIDPRLTAIAEMTANLKAQMCALDQLRDQLRVASCRPEDRGFSSADKDRLERAGVRPPKFNP